MVLEIKTVLKSKVTTFSCYMATEIQERLCLGNFVVNLFA